MRVIRTLLAAIAVAVSCLLSSAFANTYTTDQSDLWYDPVESGWGMQLVQRDLVIFATIFIYDQSRIPIWYTATLTYQGNYVWTGDLYLTNGPWFGTVPFNPNAVAYRKVGTITWNAQYVESGSITYSVDGVALTKSVVRQLLAYDNYNGIWLGAVHDTVTACSNPSGNGTFEYFATVTVAQNAQNINLTLVAQNSARLTVTGTLTQYGQFGEVAGGTYSTGVGEAGSATLFAMNVQLIQFSTEFALNSTNSGCQHKGWVGAIWHSS
jgi:hypothetical protein